MSEPEPAVGEDFAEAVLIHQEWDGREFEHCDFTGADLTGLRAANCVFTECTFARADLADARLRATAFRSCTFDRTLLRESTWDGCSLLGSSFVACKLRPCTLR